MDLLTNHYAHLFPFWNPGDAGPMPLEDRNAFFDWLRPRLLAIVGKRRLVIVPGAHTRDWRRLKLPRSQIVDIELCQGEVNDNSTALVVVACRDRHHPHPPNRKSGIEIFLRDTPDGELLTFWISIHEWRQLQVLEQKERNKKRRDRERSSRSGSLSRGPVLL